MSNPKGRTKSLQFPLKMEINQNQAKKAFPSLLENQGAERYFPKKEAKKEWKEELFFPSPHPLRIPPLAVTITLP